VSSGKFQQRRANWKDDNFILEVKAEKLKKKKPKPEKAFLIIVRQSFACMQTELFLKKIKFHFWSFLTLSKPTCVRALFDLHVIVA
jgi:hypothetical protein